MQRRFRTGWLAVAAISWAVAARAQAPKAGTSARTAPADQVVATVDGDPITASEVLKVAGNNPIPANQAELAYRSIVDDIVSTRLIVRALDRLQIKVSDKEVDDALAKDDKDLRSDRGMSLDDFLAQTGMTKAEARKRRKIQLQLEKFRKTKDTDEALNQYIRKNQDLYSGTMVRASHILLKVPAKATEAEKKAVRERLLGIKKDIESGKIGFAAAANKFSEDEGNVESKAGGELGMFARNGRKYNGGRIASEEFLAAAFALKKGSISDPVETRLGYHLIQVTDRIKGQALDTGKNKEAIRQDYLMSIQQQLIAQEKKRAKIEIKPMPRGLFATAPATERGPGGRPATSGGTPPRG